MFAWSSSLNRKDNLYLQLIHEYYISVNLLKRNSHTFELVFHSILKKHNKDAWNGTELKQWLLQGKSLLRNEMYKIYCIFFNIRKLLTAKVKLL